MKHGRVVPFALNVTEEGRRYETRCAECGRMFAIGAPRWLPDKIVIRKFKQQGMEGRGFERKDVPRELVCADCIGGSSMQKNVLFDKLPRNPGEVWVRRMRTSGANTAIRFSLPPEFGDLIYTQGVALAVRLVRLGEGGVRFKFRIPAEGEIRPGGGSWQLDGDATRWLAVRLTNKATRPVFLVNENNLAQLIGTTLLGEELWRNIKIEWQRHSDKRYTTNGEPAIAYDCPNLGAAIGAAEAPTDTETVGPQTGEAEPQTEGEPEATPMEQPVVPVDRSTYTEFSVEDSMDQLQKNLENANLHILNLQDRGWRPEISVTKDGLVQVTISRTLS